VITLAEALLMTAGPVANIADPTDLAPIVRASVQRWETLAKRDVHINASCLDVLSPIHGEEFRIVIDNLVDNALRYSPEGGTISIDLSCSDGKAVLTVSDEGPGVPEDLGDKVFERFVRADASRTRDSGGYGIGLALVKRIVVARGGTISVENRPEGGARFRVVLPGQLSEVAPSIQPLEMLKVL